ncbi:hypothetical protein [Hyphomicrobium sp. ghe19]|uniref:hypothetical protein n=1 Tax=Hyphomicrobium sp. ghe19 TaxID=2682968 RepID=UPI0030D0FE78
MVKLVKQTPDFSTPWRRVFFKFGMSQSAFARAIDRHRSKVSRDLKDEEGLISGRDQKRLLVVAKELKVVLSSSDLTPGRK